MCHSAATSCCRTCLWWTSQMWSDASTSSTEEISKVFPAHCPDMGLCRRKVPEVRYKPLWLQDSRVRLRGRMSERLWAQEDWAEEGSRLWMGPSWTIGMSVRKVVKVKITRPPHGSVNRGHTCVQLTLTKFTIPQNKILLFSFIYYISKCVYFKRFLKKSIDFSCPSPP